MTEAISRKDRRIRIKTVQEALRDYLSALPLGSRITLISFNSGISSEREWMLQSEVERQQILQWTSTLDLEAQKNGSTYLWSTLRRALQIASAYSKQGGEQAVMVRVLTDGQDTEGRWTLDKVLAEFPDVDGNNIKANIVLLGDLEIPVKMFRPGVEITKDLGWEILFPPVIQWAPQAPTTQDEVSFFDNSKSAYVRIEWSIDGVPAGAEKAVKHRFATAGEHRITAVATGAKGGKESSQVRLVVREPAKDPITVQFVYAPAIPEPGQAVKFFGRCTGKPTSYSWLLNGQEFASTLDAERVFPQEGSFEVKLVARDAAGTTEGKAQTIQVVQPTVKTAFKASPVDPIHEQPVQFVNETEGRVAGFEWDFGDGERSTESNPAHTYRNDTGASKTYTVTLTARTATGKAFTSQPLSITVKPKPPVIPPPQAAFQIVGDLQQIRAGMLVAFMDESTGFINSYAWDFAGEGSSTKKNPSFQFDTPGTKTVQLKVTGPGGTHSVSKTITVIKPQQSITLRWLNKQGETVEQPKDGIIFGNIAPQHISKKDYQCPDIDRFELVMPDDLPAGNGLGITLEGKAAAGFQIFRFLPGTSNLVALTGLATETGCYRIAPTNEADGEYKGNLKFQPQGPDCLLNGQAKEASVLLAINIGSGPNPFLIIMLLLIVGGFIFWKKFIAGPKKPQGPPPELIQITLQEEAAPGAPAPLVAPKTVQLKAYGTICLGRGGKIAGEVFDVNAPAWHLQRQSYDVELCHQDARKPKKLTDGEKFTVTDAAGKTRQLRITIASVSKNPAQPKPIGKP